MAAAARHHQIRTVNQQDQHFNPFQAQRRESPSDHPSTPKLSQSLTSLLEDVRAKYHSQLSMGNRALAILEALAESCETENERHKVRWLCDSLLKLVHLPPIKHLVRPALDLDLFLKLTVHSETATNLARTR